MINISNIYHQYYILGGTPTDQVLLNSCNSCIIIKSSKYYVLGGLLFFNSILRIIFQLFTIIPTIKIIVGYLGGPQDT